LARSSQARVVAIAAAIFWGVLFFGITDLLVVPDQDERFYEHYLLETGWGLLYTMLVMLPLVFLAVQPSWQVFPQQLTAVALTVLLCGLFTPAAGQVFVAFLLAITVTVPSVLAERPLWPIRGLSVRGANPWLSTLVLLAAAAAVVYAVQMIEAANAGRPDDNTWGLMHLPMQAALGLALAGSAAISVLAGASGASGWKLSVLPSSVSAVWLGAVSVAYPTHLGSLGWSGGIAAIVWGLAFAAITLSSPRSRRAPAR